MYVLFLFSYLSIYLSFFLFSLLTFCFHPSFIFSLTFFPSLLLPFSWLPSSFLLFFSSFLPSVLSLPFIPSSHAFFFASFHRSYISFFLPSILICRGYGQSIYALLFIDIHGQSNQNRKDKPF